LGTEVTQEEITIEEADMRQKDFGDSNSVVALSDNLVSVSSTSMADSRELVRIELKNKFHLQKWTAEAPNLGKEVHVFTVRYCDEIVGQVVLWGVEDRKASVSYWIDENYCGQGIATKAVSLVVQFAKESLELYIIEAAIREGNFSSIRVVEKLGFMLMGKKPKYLFVDGEHRDHLIYYLQLN
jgi:RimJ/RimL family protein N-acetyltransferase